jgi:hypothetical protein
LEGRSSAGRPAAARLNPLTLTVEAWRGALLSRDLPALTSRVLPLAVLAAALGRMRSAAGRY